jgi:hypothetical protein
MNRRAPKFSATHRARRQKSERPSKRRLEIEKTNVFGVTRAAFGTNVDFCHMCPIGAKFRASHRSSAPIISQQSAATRFRLTASVPFLRGRPLHRRCDTSVAGLRQGPVSVRHQVNDPAGSRSLVPPFGLIRLKALSTSQRRGCSTNTAEKPPLWVGLNVNSADDGLLSHVVGRVQEHLATHRMFESDDESSHSRAACHPLDVSIWYRLQASAQVFSTDVCGSDCHMGGNRLPNWSARHKSWW